MTNYDDIIFRTDVCYKEPHVGDLMIAQPFLDDKEFKHAVVILTAQDADRTFTGFVMNKKLTLKLSDIVEITHPECDMPIYKGGPVSTDHLFYIHNLHDIIPGGVRITDDLYFGGNFEQIVSYINSGFDFNGRLRFFLGYSGWGCVQLNEEIHENFWAINSEFDQSTLFNEGGDSYWHRQVRRLGQEVRSWRYHPLNPQNN